MNQILPKQSGQFGDTGEVSALRKSQGSQWQGLRGGGEKENVWNKYTIYSAEL